MISVNADFLLHAIFCNSNIFNFARIYFKLIPNTESSTWVQFLFKQRLFKATDFLF